MEHETGPSSSPQKRSLLLGLLGALAYVSALAFSWSKLRAPIEQSSDTPHTHDSTNDRANDSSNDSPRKIHVAETDSPPAPPQCNYSHKKSKRWFKRWKPYIFLLNLATFVAVVSYAFITRDMWKQMKRQNEIAGQQLELSERPWLEMYFTAQNPGAYFQNRGFELSMLAHIKNVGHSTATGVVIPIKAFLAFDQDTIFKEPLRRQKELCDPLLAKPVSAAQNEVQITIFPGETDESQGLGIGISKAEIDALPMDAFRVSATDKRILPIVVGCVDYQYGSSTHHHQTRFMFEIQTYKRNLPLNMYPIYAVRVDRPVPAADVVFVKYGFGGFMAN